MRVRCHFVRERLLRRYGQMRSVRESKQRELRKRGCGLRWLRQRPSLRRCGQVRVHGRVVQRRLLQQRRLRARFGTIEQQLRFGWQQVRCLRRRSGLQRGRLQLWRDQLQWVLLQRLVRHRVDFDLRGQRDRVHGLRGATELLGGQVRVRRRVVSQRLLRQQRQMPNLDHGHVRHGWRGLRGLRHWTGLHGRHVWLHRCVMRDRLLQWHELRYQPNQLGLWRGRRRLRYLRHRSALQWNGLRVRRHLVPERLLRQQRSVQDAFQLDLRYWRGRLQGMR